MRVIVYGATGMVGQGVLRECLLDEGVTDVLVVGRSATGRTDPKLREVLVSDPSDLGSVDAGATPDKLADYDACFFCLGVSSAGMSEEAYRRITYDLTLAVAEGLATRHPDMTFVYVSGQSTDTNGRRMWARVKGETEDALLALPLDAYMFRPGFIQPLHGVTSKTRLYRFAYRVITPLYPILSRIAPSWVTTSEAVGRAMLAVARDGGAGHHPKTPRIFENPDIAAVAD
jgi:uncharacterized protein YbjT (DUF2867 family)